MGNFFSFLVKNLILGAVRNSNLFKVFGAVQASELKEKPFPILPHPKANLHTGTGYVEGFQR
jgi:hypothetical protein